MNWLGWRWMFFFSSPFSFFSLPLLHKYTHLWNAWAARLDETLKARGSESSIKKIHHQVGGGLATRLICTIALIIASCNVSDTVWNHMHVCQWRCPSVTDWALIRNRCFFLIYRKSKILMFLKKKIASKQIVVKKYVGCFFSNHENVWMERKILELEVVSQRSCDAGSAMSK